MNSILFPNVKCFSELFTLDKEPPLYDNNGMRCWREMLKDCRYFSTYCSIPARGKFKHRSLAVIPKPFVLDKLNSYLVVAGNLSFEIVRQTDDPKIGLVILKYSQILADIWLAYIDASRLPRKEYPSSISREEKKNPTFKWLKYKEEYRFIKV